MVNTVYPTQIKYMNKWIMLTAGLCAWIPLMVSNFQAGSTWKRGKIPRLTHNDQKYTTFAGNRGFREKYLHAPALTWYPDRMVYMHHKIIKRTLKKHRLV